MEVNVRVHVNGPIGEQADALQLPISGARIPSFPLPRFQCFLAFATGVFSLIDSISAKHA
jgi:hypothetical protein